MEEPNGDTLGRRVLAFWGTVAAILTFGAVLVIGKKAMAPKDDDVADAGAAEFRTQKLKMTQNEQEKEFSTVEVKDGIARVSPLDAIPYAAKVLAAQKPVKSTPTPAKIQADAAEAAANKPAGQHDPNLSKFEGK
jgi:hypothetical protein